MTPPCAPAAPSEGTAAALPPPPQAPLGPPPLLFFAYDCSLFALHLSNSKSEIKVGEPEADKIMRTTSQQQSRGRGMPNACLAPPVDLGLVTARLFDQEELR